MTVEERKKSLEETMTMEGTALIESTPSTQDATSNPTAADNFKPIKATTPIHKAMPVENTTSTKKVTSTEEATSVETVAKAEDSVTFTLFPKLPEELKLKVWNLAEVPTHRIIRVRVGTERERPSPHGLGELTFSAQDKLYDSITNSESDSRSRQRFSEVKTLAIPHGQLQIGFPWKTATLFSRFNDLKTLLVVQSSRLKTRKYVNRKAEYRFENLEDVMAANIDSVEGWKKEEGMTQGLEQIAINAFQWCKDRRCPDWKIPEF
ncbi:uncharacterized protein PAC_01528 [Phialocephala subalpina]|uniref:2EXR domain-containing protein n=1 Tax=Phialocephala subalpina TaxID=576137 RepID=A0A1L7WFV6_9HELO|nr:uncharacterized protein PAC_01528 [Phialocephala subalpina]